VSTELVRCAAISRAQRRRATLLASPVAATDRASERIEDTSIRDAHQAFARARLGRETAVVDSSPISATTACAARG
jgi:hypothetical protein